MTLLKVLDIATLTGACSVALGTAATGVFCTDSQDFAALERCVLHYYALCDMFEKPFLSDVVACRVIGCGAFPFGDITLTR